MLRTERSGDVLAITLDRPDRRNALTRAALDDLAAVLADATAPVVYLHGAGSAFCAGADREEVAALDGESAAAFAAAGQATADALADYDGAVVAGIDGPARGGGVELALACDVRVCTPAATFAENGVELGLFGAWGGTARLPAVVGPSAAADLALTGRVVDAAAARRIGLVSRVTDEPAAVAATIADHDPAAVRVIADLLGRSAPGGGSGPGAEVPGGGAAACEWTVEAEREAFAELVARRAETGDGEDGDESSGTE